MILEIVTWTIKPNMEPRFEAAFEQAQTFLENAKGYKSHQFSRCIEETNKYTLLVNWGTLEDHTDGFRQSEQYLEYRALISEYYEPGAILKHYEAIYENAL